MFIESKVESRNSESRASVIGAAGRSALGTSFTIGRRSASPAGVWAVTTDGYWPSFKSFGQPGFFLLRIFIFSPSTAPASAVGGCGESAGALEVEALAAGL